jgi:hypothetical protein
MLEMLNETYGEVGAKEVGKVINEAYTKFEHKSLDESELSSWVAGEAMGYGVRAIDERHVDTAVKMAQLQALAINESNVSANVATFTSKLQPLLRRITPKLMAFDIAGVQPVPTPSSSIFMLKAYYGGNTNGFASATASIILEASTAITLVKGDTITSAGGAQGSIVYAEPDSKKLVINVTAGTFVAGEEFDKGATFTNDGNEGVVGAVYSNEAGFKQILPNYSGPYSTSTGETLGDSMNQMTVRIVSQSVTVQSRKLKAELTIELIKDMQTQHGASADKEIMYFLETEIVNDMNQEIINKYKEIAIAEANFAVATFATSAGRHGKEMYSGLYDRIIKDKVNLSARNRRGAGNILIATAGVISALYSLEKFTEIKLAPGIKPLNNSSMNFVGTLVDGTKVYQDWFANSEYYMVIYKGEGAFDNGIVFSPYAPIEILTATDPKTLQPIIGLHTRYGLTVNSLTNTAGTGVSDYCSLRVIDFTNTPLS